MAHQGDMSWDDLRYLEALGRLGTAGRAARELGTSPSTVYRRIANLEAALGVPCVHSGPGHADRGRLTEAGEALADVARQTGKAVGAVVRHLENDAATPSGEVSLTTVEGAMPVIAPALAAVTARYPELTLRLIVDDRGPSVRRREVDLAIGVMPSPPESLWGRKLFPIHYRAYGTPDAVARDPLRWICTGRGLGLADREAWEDAHARDVVVTTGSVPTLRELLVAGVGVAVYPERLGRDDERLVEMVQYRPSLAPLSRAAWLLTHPELRDVPRVRVVMEALLDACAASSSNAEEVDGPRTGGARPPS